MARDSAARYAGAMEFADDLRAFLETRVVRAYEAGAVAKNGSRLFGSPVRSSYGFGIRASLERAAPFRVDIGFSDEGVNVEAGFGLGF